MRRPPIAWVLNLDAEGELEVGRRYAPTRRLLSIVAYKQGDLRGTLVGEEDVVLAPEPNPDDERAKGLLGLAWCPTPRALARLRAAGAIPATAPAVEVLAKVNARAFAAAVREPLAEGSFGKSVAGSVEEALELLARPAPDGWLVRRPFGAAGRGRRRVAAGPPDAAERAWIEAGLRRGRLVVEPWVRVTREYTRSAWIDPGGEVWIAPPCFQKADPSGAWTGSETASASEVRDEDDSRLGRAIEVVGAALAGAGYFGSFGIDAYRHRVPGRTGTREALNPLSEINARFTMDWAIGMGEERCRSLLAAAGPTRVPGGHLPAPSASSSFFRARTSSRTKEKIR